ncbi:Inositol 2-dehydrogenase [Pseudovibrio axinellae]|uniref:Inositol 2-dehydrogenase n=1 Tax=Pseudovibrio axinellae TaxID=989403 RepID=A0A165YMJ3_9HYPH|nr:inositol 2-dehydrogenase [Pseudovibrio axinellae]KZL18986.1 Inositol 2-dehydrogenase [Pseudovibrio axinellae]SEP85075.1 myo-inositol 2-dehydrogenase [Pseudovibrio axinellae]
MTVSIGLLGAGRIGKTHAKAINQLDNAKLVAVYDPFEAAAKDIAAQTGARLDSLDAIMNDPAIDAIIIATPADLHSDQIEQAARAGKAIFCEKPIDQHSDRIRACLKVVEETGAKLMVGFNRRFDPNFAEVKRQVKAGVVGDVELVQITSRDPSPPPADCAAHSPGLFKDMMIHDFDMARFLLGEEVSEMSAMGSALFDTAIGESGDVDTASVMLKTASGKICTITNSRRATYGYDQRIEVHGSKGMISAENMRNTTVTVANGDGYTVEPLMDFFMERYEAAYRIELTSFVNALNDGTAMSPNGFDGLKALELAETAAADVAKARELANS